MKLFLKNLSKLGFLKMKAQLNFSWTFSKDNIIFCTCVQNHMKYKNASTTIIDINVIIIIFILLFSERNFLLHNSKIIYGVKIRRTLYHWSTIGDLHASIIGDPRFSLETPRFSLEIPRFSLKTPRFLLETPRLLLETPRFALETPIFSLKTPDFC